MSNKIKTWSGVGAGIGIVFVGVCFFVGLAMAQPIEPTRDIKSKSTATANAIDLPYKPDESLFQTMTSTDTINTMLDGTAEDPKEKFDFAKVPFIPFKGPALRPAGDPEF